MSLRLRPAACVFLSLSLIFIFFKKNFASPYLRIERRCHRRASQPAEVSPIAHNAIDLTRATCPPNVHVSAARPSVNLGGSEQKKGGTQRRFTPYCQVCLSTTVQMAIKFVAHLATSSRTSSQRLAQTDRWSFTGCQPSLLLTGGLWK